MNFLDSLKGNTVLDKLEGGGFFSFFGITAFKNSKSVDFYTNSQGKKFIKGKKYYVLKRSEKYSDIDTQISQMNGPYYEYLGDEWKNLGLFKLENIKSYFSGINKDKTFGVFQKNGLNNFVHDLDDITYDDNNMFYVNKNKSRQRGEENDDIQLDKIMILDEKTYEKNEKYFKLFGVD